MKLEWRDYVGDRLIADHPGGFKVIKPKQETSSGRPLFCPLCDGIFSSEFDEDAWKKFQCCDSCAARWVYPNMQKWQSGWRPSIDDLNGKTS